VPLVVVQEEEIVSGRAEVCEPARYAAAALCKLIGIDEVELRPALDLRGADSSLPSAIRALAIVSGKKILEFASTP